MNLKFFKFAVLTLGLLSLQLFSFQLNAALVDDLYVVELPVVDQTSQLRIDTFKQALADVLVKISGSGDLLMNPEFNSPLQNGIRYVEGFRYERQALAEDAVEESQVNLRVEFSQKQIDALLRSKGYSVWGRVRPSILIVMSQRINRKYELVSEESAPDLIEQLDKLSQKHGLPTQFPLLDLEDRAVLNFKESALDNIDAINDLAFRYQSDVIFTGELVGITGKGWTGKWQSQFSDKLFQWEDKASTKEKVMFQAMAHLAEILAQEYALGTVKENASSVFIEVSNIVTLEEYLMVGRYFSNLSVVEKTHVKLLTPNSVSFNLELRNSPAELQRLIELGDVIEQVDLPIIDSTVEPAIDDEFVQESLSLTYQLLK